MKHDDGTESFEICDRGDYVVATACCSAGHRYTGYGETAEDAMAQIVEEFMLRATGCNQCGTLILIGYATLKLHG